MYNKTGPGYHFESYIFTEILYEYLNLVWKLKIQGPQGTDKNCLVEPTMLWGCG